MATGTVTNPLASVIDGLLAGHGLAQQIKRQKLEEEAFARRSALEDQEASISDIMNRMKLEDAGRPVMGGTVEDLSVIPGTGSPNKFPIMRPADKSRTVKYKNRAGESNEYELFTPEEQFQRSTERSRAGKVPVKIGDTVAWLDADKAPTAMSVLQQMELTETPQDFRAMGGPAQVPRRNLQGVFQTMLQNAGIKSRETTATDNRNAANTRNEASIKSREAVATGNRTAANTRAVQANQSRERTAAGRNAAATANTQALTNRPVSQTAIASREEQFRKEEGELHAERRKMSAMLSLGVDAKGTKLTTEGRKLVETDRQSAASKLQELQKSKAKLYGMKTPPDDVIGKIGEGQTVTSPDGRTWKKEDGVLYFVK